MINPNFKNVTENLIYIITTNIITAIIVFNTSTKANQKAIEGFAPTIQKAIDKETIKNEVLHDVKVNIEKIKKSDSLHINIKQNPETDQKPVNILQADCDCFITNTTFNNLKESKQRRIQNILK